MACSLILSGCLDSPPPKKLTAPEKKQNSQKEKATTEIHSTPGFADAFGPQPSREKRWRIYWQAANLLAAGEMKPFSGALKLVHGQIYRKDKPELTFQAQNGRADKDNKTLTLNGSVKITSSDGKAELEADTIDYFSAQHLLRARGNVRATNELGTLDPLPELLATSDLKEVATPDAFQR